LVHLRCPRCIHAPMFSTCTALSLFVLFFFSLSHLLLSSLPIIAFAAAGI
jgi:hypothetical protein